MRAGPDIQGASFLAARPASLASVRAKMYGRPLTEGQIGGIVDDLAAGSYTDVETAAFLVATAHRNLSMREVVALTRAMAATGKTMAWPGRRSVDKHCVGGVPGNRTTPIIVAIAASLGVTMPKTSSRAITSAAGTADVMATMAPVELDEAKVRQVVERTNGCVVWGGAMGMAPADDRLVRIERQLDINMPVHIVASVLAKKMASGASSVLVDIPVGPSAKLRTREDAEVLAEMFYCVANELGVAIRAVFTDGTQPVGRGIGPALEARDVLAVLRRAPDAPAALRDRAIRLAASVLVLADPGMTELGARRLAAEALASGRAGTRFEAICEAQGGMRVPPIARHARAVVAKVDGRVTAMKCRELARLAKLAGAPDIPEAGVLLLVGVGDRVHRGQPLFEVHATSEAMLDHAVAYASSRDDLLFIDCHRDAVA